MPYSAPAIGLLEVASIARGYVVADAMVKKAPVRLVRSEAVTPGKYLVLVNGEVADVDEAMQAGEAAGRGLVLDKLFLPQVHAQVADCLAGTHVSGAVDALGVVEFFTVASAIVAADAACKAAEVVMIELRLAFGIGGKAYFSLTGELHMVEAALDAARAAVPGMLVVNHELIPAPHPDLVEKVG